MRHLCGITAVIALGLLFTSTTATSPYIPRKCAGTVAFENKPDCCKLVNIGCVKLGESCSTTGSFFAPTSCEKGLVCVLTEFSNLAFDAPSSGTCQSLDEIPPKCSVEFCSKDGAESLCSSVDAIDNDVVATCGAFATRSNGGPSADCDFACTQECLPEPDRLLASNGKLYCNLCGLQLASCRSNFEIFGPVEAPKDPCKGEISIFDAAQCCREKGVGCLQSGQACSTVAQVPPVPCAEGLTCVISDFGFIAADRPDRGVCRKVSHRPKTCSVNRCSRRGPKYVCRVPLPRGNNTIATCRAWANRSDGNTGPDCKVACTKRCLPGRARPLASNGKRYCSVCVLRGVSCLSKFMIYGPVRGH